MVTVKRLALVGALVMAVQSTAAAQVQFYNGDFAGGNAVYSATDESGGRTLLYENFTVAGTGMYVTGLFGVFLSNSAWTTAYWEIRSGVTAGDGGTLLSSGSTGATRVFIGAAQGYNVYESAISGLNYFLAPGEYWFGLGPEATIVDGTFLATTSGANGVNANLDGDSYFNSAHFEYSFSPDIGGNFNFALGVEGRLAESTVPEPATVTLLATGLAGLAGARRRKRTNA